MYKVQLSTVVIDHIYLNYDPERMHQENVALVYPHTEFKFIWDEFVEIQRFYQEAAIHQNAVITFIEYDYD